MSLYLTKMRTISSERDGEGRGGKKREGEGLGEKGGMKSEGEGWGEKGEEEKGRRGIGREGGRKDSVPVQNKQKTKQNKKQ